MARGTIARMTGVSDLVRTLLAKRGIVEADEIERFLAPDYERDLHDPFLMPDMRVAVERILLALERDERIAIYCDYDCDGIPGGSLLFRFFKRIGYTPEIYVPHRDREGYGVHIHAIEELAARGVSLIVTVDVGIVAFEAAAHARKIGVEMIITDHHELRPSETGTRELGYDLPDALAVINPKRAGYPFPHLCGAGTAFKLACAILTEGRKRGLERFTSIPLGWEKWLLDLAAISTIADMVPLVGENRAIAHFGLRVLRRTPRPGLRALALSARFNLAQADEETIGFSIAPRVNAASRMDEPELALRLLTTDDEREAAELAAQLESLNASRKGVVASITKEAKRRVRDRYDERDRVVVLGDPTWKPSLLGLSANAIVEDRGGVAFLWGRDGKGELKGSCRSDGTLSVVELMTLARDVFAEFGGHHASGGFSVSHENVHELPAALARAAEMIESAGPTDVCTQHDADLSLSQVTWSVFQELSRVAPFGIGNPKPVFRIARIFVNEVRRFGKEKHHTEISLACHDTATSMRAFDFFIAPEQFTHEPFRGAEVDVLATIERDAFRGPTRLALRLVDVLSPRA
ncbi:single-stranded-DNA-specific exonuclease RecJ [Candidatus Kaiserbacteria bacterium]|nr:single-stranded-DNA-specific exonuclease RecJ [Candidatus Kaiserbacteria bacterium]